MMEECFYCGEEASRTDIDRLGKCPSCMEQIHALPFIVTKNKVVHTHMAVAPCAN